MLCSKILKYYYVLSHDIAHHRVLQQYLNYNSWWLWDSKPYILNTLDSTAHTDFSRCGWVAAGIYAGYYFGTALAALTPFPPTWCWVRTWGPLQVWNQVLGPGKHHWANSQGSRMVTAPILAWHKKCLLLPRYAERAIVCGCCLIWNITACYYVSTTPP